MPKRPPPGFHARRAAARARSVAEPGAERSKQVAASTARPHAYPVGRIVSRILTTLQSDPALTDLWLEGEIRSFNRSGAGHIYFDLADDHGALSCVFFKRVNAGVRIAQGDQVLVHGKVEIYRPRGALQIMVDSVQPIGAGVLEAEYQRLFQGLKREGLFAPERKRPLPAYPHRIGVVTSSSGAVWHDIQNVLSRRWPLATLALSPCLTQGEGAAESIAAALAALNEQDDSDSPDVIIVARGGGSPEDLWAYNEEPVARAIFASGIPVVSAVGHETDVTIADYVADRRAPTPSAAAEVVAPSRDEESARVRGLRTAADDLLARRVADARQFVNAADDRLDRATPAPASLRVDLHALIQHLERAVAGELSGRAAALAADQGRLTALDPRATLARGYAIIADPSGRPITSAAAIAPGDPLRIQMHDGVVSAQADAVNRRPESQPRSDTA